MARIAIITGAAGGLGTAFTRLVSSDDRIDEIWAVGRNQQKLDELKMAYPKVVPLCADLLAGGLEEILQKLDEEKPDVGLLINNAGAAYLGHYEKMGLPKTRDLCSINCTVPAELIIACLPYMQEGAGILNISSASSFQPNPYLALYSASKVFLKNLSRALHMELKPRGITVTAVCPGWVDTDMLPREKNGRKIRYTGMVSAEKVAEQALRDHQKGKDMSTPGFFSKYLRFYSKVTPTRIIMKQWAAIIDKYL